MRYGKKKVNRIVDQILVAARMAGKDVVGFDVEFEHKVEMIREQYRLVDRRLSSTPEYATEIIIDFLEHALSYKDLMRKYHCSERTVKSLLLDAASSDHRIRDEIAYRAKD